MLTASTLALITKGGSEVVVRKILNYTPHVVTIYRGERVIHSYPSLGCARVVTKEEKSAHILGIPIKQITERRVEGLPAPEEGDGLYRIFYCSLLFGWCA